MNKGISSFFLCAFHQTVLTDTLHAVLRLMSPRFLVDSVAVVAVTMMVMILLPLLRLFLLLLLLVVGRVLSALARALSKVALLVENATLYRQQEQLSKSVLRTRLVLASTLESSRTVGLLATHVLVVDRALVKRDTDTRLQLHAVHWRRRCFCGRGRHDGRGAYCYLWLLRTLAHVSSCVIEACCVGDPKTTCSICPKERN